MPTASPAVLTAGLVVAVLAALVALALAAAAWRRSRGRRESGATGGGRRPVPPDADGLVLAVCDLQEAVARLRDSHAQAVRHLSVVRYDALHELGGRMSFSMAMLDGDGDGLVLTVINGRSEARTYVKAVSARTGRQELSPEEREAVEAAMRGARRPEPVTA